MFAVQIFLCHHWSFFALLWRFLRLFCCPNQWLHVSEVFNLMLGETVHTVHWKQAYHDPCELLSSCPPEAYLSNAWSKACSVPSYSITCVLLLRLVCWMKVLSKKDFSQHSVSVKQRLRQSSSQQDQLPNYRIIPYWLCSAQVRADYEKVAVVMILKKQSVPFRIRHRLKTCFRYQRITLNALFSVLKWIKQEWTPFRQLISNALCLFPWPRL